MNCTSPRILLILFCLQASGHLLLTFHNHHYPLSSSCHPRLFFLLSNHTRRHHHIMSNLNGGSHGVRALPTLSPAARDENRRPFLNLNQPLTSMGRRHPSHIQTPALNQHLPQPTFSATYDPTTQNFEVALCQEVGGPHWILIYAYAPETDIPEVSHFRGDPRPA